MKKFALTALAAAVSIVGFASVASADSRNRGDDEQWPRHGQQDDRNWNDNRGDGRHADRGDDNGWRGDRDHDRDRWRRDHWRPAPRWHGPRVIVRDDYCFVKKVRRYDDWGNMYIKRVRICR